METRSGTKIRKIIQLNLHIMPIFEGNGDLKTNQDTSQEGRSEIRGKYGE